MSVEAAELGRRAGEQAAYDLTANRIQLALNDLGRALDRFLFELGEWVEEERRWKEMEP